MTNSAKKEPPNVTCGQQMFDHIIDSGPPSLVWFTNVYQLPNLIPITHSHPSPSLGSVYAHSALTYSPTLSLTQRCSHPTQPWLHVHGTLTSSPLAGSKEQDHTYLLPMQS